MSSGSPGFSGMVPGAVRQDNRDDPPEQAAELGVRSTPGGAVDEPFVIDPEEDRPSDGRGRDRA
jgi:hypothetical protein